MRFILRRLGFFLVTVWAAVTFNFVIPRLMPGDPATAILARIGAHGHVSPSLMRAIESEFGKSHASLMSQYFDYWKNCLTLNFGVSTFQAPESVARYISSGIWWTFGLVGITTILGFALGTLVGTVSAWRRGSKLDSLMPPIFVITSAFPYFWIGLMSVLLFFNILHWLPSENGFDVYSYSHPELSLGFIGSVVQHGILPAATILITSIGGWILTMRNNMITTLSEDYVRMARAKGLRSSRIMFDYAARNAILPNLTGFAMSLGFVVSGAILVEYVFNYPGVGYMLLNAVENQDYPVMQALFLLITIAVLLAILAADIATALLDPRTRSER